MVLLSIMFLTSWFCSRDTSFVGFYDKPKMLTVDLLLNGVEEETEQIMRCMRLLGTLWRLKALHN